MYVKEWRQSFRLCKSPRFPWGKRLGGPQSRSGCDGKQKIPFLYRESNSSVQPVAIHFAHNYPYYVFYHWRNFMLIHVIFYC
jgi:hypothetical protein